jgi:hypothetical protein
MEEYRIYTGYLNHYSRVMKSVSRLHGGPVSLVFLDMGIFFAWGGVVKTD